MKHHIAMMLMIERSHLFIQKICLKSILSSAYIFEPKAVGHSFFKTACIQQSTDTYLHRTKSLLLLFFLYVAVAWIPAQLVRRGRLRIFKVTPNAGVYGYNVWYAITTALTDNIGGDSNMGRSNYLATTRFTQNIQFTNIQIFNK